MQALVYSTNSVFREENENVVTKVTEYINARTSGKNPFRLIPPVLPLTPAELEMQSSSKFLKMEPSNVMGGCFLSVMSREVRDYQYLSPLSTVLHCVILCLLTHRGTD